MKKIKLERVTEIRCKSVKVPKRVKTLDQLSKFLEQKRFEDLVIDGPLSLRVKTEVTRIETQAEARDRSERDERAVARDNLTVTYTNTKTGKSVTSKFGDMDFKWMKII